MKNNKIKISSFLGLLILFSGKILGQISPNDSLDFEQDSLSIAVSNDAMNMLYIGLDNPVSIAVSGYSQDEIIVKISDGNITKNGNNYFVNVSKRGEVDIEIYSNGNDSDLTLLGIKKFRVRDIPRPEAQLGTLTNVQSNLAVLLANGTKIYASLGSAFVYDGIKYNVIEFTFTLAKKRGESNAGVRVMGNRLNEACRELLLDMVSGDIIIIDGIKAEGPGGIKLLAPIVISAR